MGTVYAKSEEHSSILPSITQEPIRSEPQQQSDSREIYLDGVKARVDKIHVDGLARTKDDIIEDCIRDLFKATDFQDVLLKAHRVFTNDITSQFYDRWVSGASQTRRVGLF
jgi:outer membrane protein insertion porin family